MAATNINETGYSNGSTAKKKKAIHKTIGAGSSAPRCTAASEQRLLSSFTRNLQTMLIHFHFHRYAPCAFTLPAARRFLATPMSLRIYYRVLPVAATRAILSQHERTRMRRDRLGSYYRTSFDTMRYRECANTANGIDVQIGGGGV